MEGQQRASLAAAAAYARQHMLGPQGVTEKVVCCAAAGALSIDRVLADDMRCHALAGICLCVVGLLKACAVVLDICS
jgi:hypothetical protein